MTNGIWVTIGPGLPCGARPLGDSVLGPADAGRVWLDVCVLGQHLPQMYREEEARVLRAEDCARLGLCPDCLGFGDMNPGPVDDVLHAARGIDKVSQPCPGCGGSGRPAVRVTVNRGLPGVTGSIRPLPHQYVPPPGDAGRELTAASEVPADMCLACVMLRDGRGPRGEALHT